MNSRRTDKVADTDVAKKRIGWQQLLEREKEKTRECENDDDRDLKKIEKHFGLCAFAIRLRKEEHHEDGSAVETEEHSPG